MCEGYVEKPLYLLIAEWMMAENRWVIVDWPPESPDNQYHLNK